MSVDSISDRELVGRAIKSARDPSRLGLPHWRWIAVMHAFALGSNYSRELCARYGLDPDEAVVERPPEGMKLTHDGGEEDET